MTVLLELIRWVTAAFESLPEWIQVLFAVAGGIILFILVYWSLSHYPNGEPKKVGTMCRACGQRKETMALTYGEDEGLCRECLDEYLPLAIGDKPKKEGK